MSVCSGQRFAGALRTAGARTFGVQPASRPARRPASQPLDASGRHKLPCASSPGRAAPNEPPVLPVLTAPVAAAPAAKYEQACAGPSLTSSAALLPPSPNVSHCRSVDSMRHSDIESCQHVAGAHENGIISSICRFLEYSIGGVGQRGLCCSAGRVALRGATVAGSAPHSGARTSRGVPTLRRRACAIRAGCPPPGVPRQRRCPAPAGPLAASWPVRTPFAPIWLYVELETTTWGHPGASSRRTVFMWLNVAVR